MNLCSVVPVPGSQLLFLFFAQEAERSFRRLFPFQRYPGISLCKLIRFGKKGIAKFSVKTLPFDSNVTITPMDIHREVICRWPYSVL